jgi:hypothetical protein
MIWFLCTRVHPKKPSTNNKPKYHLAILDNQTPSDLIIKNIVVQGKNNNILLALKQEKTYAMSQAIKQSNST